MATMNFVSFARFVRAAGVDVRNPVATRSEGKRKRLRNKVRNRVRRNYLFHVAGRPRCRVGWSSETPSQCLAIPLKKRYDGAINCVRAHGPTANVPQEGTIIILKALSGEQIDEVVRVSEELRKGK